MTRPPGSATTLAAIVSAYGDRPFTVADATGDVATTRGLRSCLAAGQLVLVRPRVLMDRDALVAAASDARAYHLVQVRAALASLRRPGWSSVESAALVHDLPRRLGASGPRTVSIDVPGLPDRVETALPAPAGLPPFLPVHLHGTGLADVERESLDGIAVTSLARTAVELARGRPLWLALVPVDAAIRRLVLDSVTSRSDPRVLLAQRPDLVDAARAALRDVVSRMRGWPGVVAARAAITYGDPRAESPLESCSRGHMVDGQLPAAELGARVVGGDGRTYFGDFVWDRERVIGECDGWSKYALGADPMAGLRREKVREDALRSAGWVVVRWTADDLRASAPAVVGRLRRTLDEARPRRAG